MNDFSQQLKNQRTIKTFSWNVISISVLGFLLGLYGLIFYLRNDIDFQSIPQNSLADFFNPRLYFIQSIIQICISIILIVSSIYVLKYSEKWRKALLYGLIITILFLIITPIINIGNIPNVDTRLESWGHAKTTIVIWSVSVSYCFAIFFSIVIAKFSKDGIRKLFK